jgi:hypothetical protein
MIIRWSKKLNSVTGNFLLLTIQQNVEVIWVGVVVVVVEASRVLRFFAKTLLLFLGLLFDLISRTATQRGRQWQVVGAMGRAAHSLNFSSIQVGVSNCDCFTVFQKKNHFWSRQRKFNS